MLKRSPLRRSSAPIRRTGRLKRSRRSAEDAQWSRAIRERDGHICQRCGGQGDQAHHIATRARRPDLRFELSNGICLDGACHEWVHAHPKEATAAGLLSDEKYEARSLFHHEPIEPASMTAEESEAFKAKCRESIIGIARRTV